MQENSNKGESTLGWLTDSYSSLLGQKIESWSFLTPLYVAGCGQQQLERPI